MVNFCDHFSFYNNDLRADIPDFDFRIMASFPVSFTQRNSATLSENGSRGVRGLAQSFYADDKSFVPNPRRYQDSGKNSGNSGRSLSELQKQPWRVHLLYLYYSL